MVQQEQRHTVSASSARVLVVDDDAHIRESLQEILDFAGYVAVPAGDGKTALDLLARQPVNLMLLDLEVPRISGMEVLRRVATAYPHIPVVIISGRGTIQTAVEATKLGAYDFLEKPVDARRTLLTVRNAIDKVRLQHQRDRLLREAQARYRMIGSSPSMQTVYDLVDRAAATQAKVLILGESGTGKEMVARAIHHNSTRAGHPFVTLNCAAIPETLIESELFGYEKGAFTGARTPHPGKFEQAHRGTLFLDEIGDMSLMTQAKTLRVLQENRIERLGSTRSIDVDVRIIAATNKHLEREIAEGTFREDLYYRLNIITISLPPLRDRFEDIPALAHHFLDLFCTHNGVPPKTLGHRALALLVKHDWPGNVRELRNVIERLVVLSDDEEIRVPDVQQALARTPMRTTQVPHTDLRAAREHFESAFIRKALVAHDWKIQDTAESLGIDRSHLWKKMRQFDITQPE